MVLNLGFRSDSNKEDLKQVQGGGRFLPWLIYEETIYFWTSMWGQIRTIVYFLFVYVLMHIDSIKIINA